MKLSFAFSDGDTFGTLRIVDGRREFIATVVGFADRRIVVSAVRDGSGQDLGGRYEIHGAQFQDVEPGDRIRFVATIDVRRFWSGFVIRLMRPHRLPIVRAVHDGGEVAA